ncbi:MAG: GNAT family N-acetyltransferase [Gammaproteobacteria bacterium]|nr:GNAT family N-acetyltransferase [Gammaproteobacteria bacterium]
MGRTDHRCGIRLARRAEARTIAVMSRELIESGLGWSWTTARVRHSIADVDTNVIVAVDGERVVGFALMHYREERAHLLLFAVAADRRRRGIGSSLWAWLERTALVAGISTVHLEVRASNPPARRFYRHLGFVEEETVPGYYRGREAAVRMRCRLGVGAGGSPPLR